MLFQKDKSNLSTFYALIILITHINSSFCSQIQKRFLQYDDYNNDYNNDYNTSNTTSTSFAEDPGSYLLAWFFIFFFMGLYIICNMKKYPSVANKTDDVWKFMFFANNGILVASGVNVFNIKNILLGGGPFGLSSIVFLIGCFYYICKFTKECNYQYAYKYFDGSKISELNKLPCFVWSLVGLTDPCCRIGGEDNVIIIYSSESTYCCHSIWNIFIFILKRFAVFFTFISFYIFLIFFIIFWFIAKGIFYLILYCKETGSKDVKTNDGTNGDVDGGDKETNAEKKSDNISEKKSVKEFQKPNQNNDNNNQSNHSHEQKEVEENKNPCPQNNIIKANNHNENEEQKGSENVSKNNENNMEIPPCP